MHHLIWWKQIILFTVFSEFIYPWKHMQFYITAIINVHHTIRTHICYQGDTAPQIVSTEHRRLFNVQNQLPPLCSPVICVNAIWMICYCGQPLLLPNANFLRHLSSKAAKCIEDGLKQLKNSMVTVISQKDRGEPWINFTQTRMGAEPRKIYLLGIIACLTVLN